MTYIISSSPIPSEKEDEASDADLIASITWPQVFNALSSAIRVQCLPHDRRKRTIVLIPPEQHKPSRSPLRSSDRVFRKVSTSIPQPNDPEDPHNQILPQLTKTASGHKKMITKKMKQSMKGKAKVM